MNIWYFPINWWFNLHFCTTVACVKKWVEYPKSWPSWPLKERTLGDQPGCLIFGYVERVWPTSDLKASPDTVELCWTGISSTPLFLLADFQRMFFFLMQLVQHLVLALARVAFSSECYFFTEFSRSHLNPLKGTPINRQNWASPKVREVTFFLFFSNPLFHQCLQHNVISWDIYI